MIFKTSRTTHYQFFNNYFHAQQKTNPKLKHHRSKPDSKIEQNFEKRP